MFFLRMEWEKKEKNTQILKHADFSSKLKQVYSESDQEQECHRLH